MVTISLPSPTLHIHLIPTIFPYGKAIVAISQVRVLRTRGNSKQLIKRTARIQNPATWLQSLCSPCAHGACWQGPGQLLSYY